MPVVPFKAPLWLITELDDIAYRFGTTRSELIRIYVKDLIENDPYPGITMPDGGQIYTVRLPFDIIYKMDNYGYRYRLSRSEIIRIAIMICINQNSSLSAKIESGGKIF